MCKIMCKDGRLYEIIIIYYWMCEIIWGCGRVLGDVTEYDVGGMVGCGRIWVWEDVRDDRRILVFVMVVGYFCSYVSTWCVCRNTNCRMVKINNTRTPPCLIRNVQGTLSLLPGNFTNQLDDAIFPAWAPIAALYCSRLQPISSTVRFYEIFRDIMHH